MQGTPCSGILRFYFMGWLCFLRTEAGKGMLKILRKVSPKESSPNWRKNQLSSKKGQFHIGAVLLPDKLGILFVVLRFF